MVKKTIKKIESEAVKESENGEKKLPKRKGCIFCGTKQSPSYTDLTTLKRFLSERSKILPKTYTHLCSKHQRATSKQIKHARHLALLPFTPKI